MKTKIHDTSQLIIFTFIIYLELTEPMTIILIIMQETMQSLSSIDNLIKFHRTSYVQVQKKSH